MVAEVFLVIFFCGHILGIVSMENDERFNKRNIPRLWPYF